MITIENLAHRYSLLPSELLARGSTFDLEVLNVSTQYDNHMRKKDDKKKTFNTSNGPPEAPKLSEDQMNNMIARVKDAKS